MNLSHRITNLTPSGSDGWEVFYKARAMKAAGHDITELTIGEHDIRTHPSILDAMHKAALGGHTGYAMVPGIVELRTAIAERIETQTGVATGLENIFITPGGQSALFATHHAVLDDGDTALFVDPYYATYPGTIRGVGGVPLAVPAFPENGFQPKASDIASRAAGAKSLLINSPNNPTGAVYSRATMEEIANTCKAHDLWLISDEVYDTQVWEGEHISPRALPDMVKRTLVVGSMSKSHAMTGSRIGWVCGPAEVINHLINLATHTTYGVPGYIQDAALFALKQGRHLEEEVSAPFKRRREITERLLAGQNIVKTSPTQGAMYAMLDVRVTGLSGFDFANALLDERHIATMPGESFGTTAAGHIRVAMTIDDERYANAIQTLIAFASERAT